MKTQPHSTWCIHVAAVVMAIVHPAARSRGMVIASISPPRDLVTAPLHWIPAHLDLGRYRH